LSRERRWEVKHRIALDGHARDTDIRAMDESFVVYRTMYVPPLTREDIRITH
jgi:hypothetical protein